MFTAMPQNSHLVFGHTDAISLQSFNGNLPTNSFDTNLTSHYLKVGYINSDTEVFGWPTIAIDTHVLLVTPDVADVAYVLLNIFSIHNVNLKKKLIRPTLN